MADKNEHNSDISKREEKILEFWNKNDIFKKSEKKDAPQGEFVFYDGPPFATGLPHYGHILAGTIKDAIPRYKTMCGYRVKRRWGWDCHGLPVENEIEKELNLKTKQDIEAYGIEKFNSKARDSVLRYADDWKRIIPRMGRWVDMERDYKTMDTSYTESVWWVFKTLYDKHLVYEGFKSMHLCPRCETTLSNFEVNQGYKDITDFAVTIKLELKDTPNTYLLVWTTTAWTLPGNMAAAVRNDAEYVQVKSFRGMQIIDGVSPGTYIVAKDVFWRNIQGNAGLTKLRNLFEDREKLIKDARKYVSNQDGFFEQYKEQITIIRGSDLVGKSYIPPFDYYKNTNLSGKKNAWKVYHAPFVSMDEGTGIVHLAPAFGQEDMDLAQKNGIPLVHHVGTDGKFKKEVKDFAGLSVKPKEDPQKTDIEIIKYLSHKGLLFAKEKIKHSYPHCWRCDTPLLNYAASSWFIKVTAIKHKLVSENKKIQWVPKEVGQKRFGKWLENSPDWAMSRSRYWGAPLPVWKCNDSKKKDCKNIIVLGSISELKEKAIQKIPNDPDLHRPYIDSYTIKCECGGTMKRVPEVFDCWFESGSMPYGQFHYPFENKDIFDPAPGLFRKPRGFPADFIAEGMDQTRGWFYSLIVLGIALFGKSPYKNVIVNGTTLAEDGQKMGKRLKNYPDPMGVVHSYGADSLRFYLLSSSIMRGEDLNFSEQGVAEVMRKIVMRLSHIHSFYALYANGQLKGNSDSRHILDRWILSRLNQLIAEVSESMEKYELDRATRPIAVFTDDFSTWYLRRSRDRFKGDDQNDKQRALETTAFVFLELSKTIAPFMPFFAEELYQQVKSTAQAGSVESVHLDHWPKGGAVDENVLVDMHEVRAIVSSGLELRDEASIKVRQPLQKLRVKNKKFIGRNELITLIQDEVNVKEVVFDDLVTASVLLDTEITTELKEEGIIRDFVRRVQELRKKDKLTPRDTASLVVETGDAEKRLIEMYEKTIKKTALLDTITFMPNSAEAFTIGVHTFKIELKQK